MGSGSGSGSSSFAAAAATAAPPPAAAAAVAGTASGSGSTSAAAGVSFSTGFSSSSFAAAAAAAPPAPAAAAAAGATDSGSTSSMFASSSTSSVSSSCVSSSGLSSSPSSSSSSSSSVAVAATTAAAAPPATAAAATTGTGPRSIVSSTVSVPSGCFVVVLTTIVPSSSFVFSIVTSVWAAGATGTGTGSSGFSTSFVVFLGTGCSSSSLSTLGIQQQTTPVIKYTIAEANAMMAPFSNVQPPSHIFDEYTKNMQAVNAQQSNATEAYIMRQHLALKHPQQKAHHIPSQVHKPIKAARFPVPRATFNQMEVQNLVVSIILPPSPLLVPSQLIKIHSPERGLWICHIPKVSPLRSLETKVQTTTDTIFKALAIMKKITQKTNVPVTQHRLAMVIYLLSWFFQSRDFRLVFIVSFEWIIDRPMRLLLTF